MKDVVLRSTKHSRNLRPITVAPHTRMLQVMDEGRSKSKSSVPQPRTFHPLPAAGAPGERGLEVQSVQPVLQAVGPGDSVVVVTLLMTMHPRATLEQHHAFLGSDHFTLQSDANNTFYTTSYPTLPTT